MSAEFVAWLNATFTTNRVFSAIIAGIAIYAFVVARHATDNTARRFSVEDMVLGRDGRTSLSKVGQFIALIVSSWGFIYMTLDYKLTEWYFASYMVAWAGANAAKSWIESKKTSEKEG